jgi:hypothetical protein
MQDLPMAMHHQELQAPFKFLNEVPRTQSPLNPGDTDSTFTPHGYISHGKTNHSSTDSNWRMCFKG